MKEKIGINLIKNYNIQVGSHPKPELPIKAATTRTNMKEKIGINLIKNYNIQVGSHPKPELPTKAATTRTKS
jgi:hypothetical protein